MRWLSKYWPIIPLLLIVVLARDWVEEAPTSVVVEDTIDMSQTRSDYYLEDFTTRKFDENGELQYRVSGSSLLHYPEDDRSEIIAPSVILRREGIRWDITSIEGELLRNPDTLTLQGDVRLERTSRVEAAEFDDVVEIRTERLSVRTDTNEVSTDQPIEVIADGWRMQSVGLESRIDEGKLIFLSKVTGHYDVPNPDSE